MTEHPLLRIVYLRNIFDYAYDDNVRELLRIRYVNSSWDECVMEYSFDIWKRICKKKLIYAGYSLLKNCIYHCGHPRMVNLLLKFTKSNDINSAFFQLLDLLSCNKYRLEHLELFLKAGVDVTVECEFQQTVLHYACNYNTSNCMK